MLPRTTSWLRVALLATGPGGPEAIGRAGGHRGPLLRHGWPSGSKRDAVRRRFLFDPAHAPTNPEKDPSPSWARWTTSS